MSATVAARRTTSPWLLRGLLALPFLVGIAVLQGLTVEIDTFHGTDARVYQLPTILQLSERLDFSDYPSAQTPLYHVLTAWWGELVGFELWKLRLLNVLFSYAMAVALLRLLRRATPLEDWQAFWLTLVFVLSPYVLGASFTLLTDNLAILFALIALERVHAYSSTGSLGAFALACLAICAALLTRQAFVWLLPVAAFFLLLRSAPPRVKLTGLVLLGLSVVPFGLLALSWGGLVPPSADPASCGLCDDRQGLAREALTLRTVGFTIALVGAYGTVVYAVAALRSRTLGLPSPRMLVVAIGAGVALLLVSPLLYKPITPAQAGDAGWLWKVSDRFPEVLGSSVVFWVLVPLGCLILALLVQRAGPLSLGPVYFACFLLAALPVRLVYQKYFDPFVLLALVLLALPPDLRQRSDYAGVALLGLAFVAYALSFAG